jgi:hypothetical protein
MNAVVALLAEWSAERGLVAGFEEEGVPLSCEPALGSAEELAREAASRSALGLGIGGDGERLVLGIAASPRRPYLVSSLDRSREFGRAAARVAAHRPLPTPDW